MEYGKQNKIILELQLPKNIKKKQSKDIQWHDEDDEDDTVDAAGSFCVDGSPCCCC